MKILVISNIYPPFVRGGYEVECAGVVELLRDRGDDVHVLTTRVDPAVARDAFVERSLHDVPPKGRALKLAPFTTLSDRRTLEKQLDAFVPDLAFVWNGAHIPHVTIYDLLAAGVPTAFRICEHWFGDLFSNDPYMRYLTGGGSVKRRTWSSAIRLANQLPSLRLEPWIEADIGISWASWFMRNNVPTPRGLRPVVEQVTHPTTQNAQLFAAVERVPSETPVVAFVGRLSSEKGAAVAIAALGALTTAGHDVRLVLAGDGTDRERARLDEAADRAGVTDRCDFAGRLDVEGVCALLGRATALVVPSTWEEPFPITIVEGALARVPIVASRVGGIPEVLAEGKEVLLAASGNADELAKRIEAILVRPDDARRRAARAFTRAQELSWEAYSAEMMAFVDATAHTAGMSSPARTEELRALN